jgi:hypothetical protein
MNRFCNGFFLDDGDEMSDALALAWALLADATPLARDCGTLCAAACCAPDEDGQGAVALFPGERERIGDVRWARIERAGDCDVLTCEGACERAKRPLGCRMFPLTPVVRGGAWTVRMDRRAWAMCPLMAYGVKGLDARFVEAARAAVHALAQDARMREALRAWARVERMYRQPLI